MAETSGTVIADARLRELLEYWRSKRASRRMPARADIDPIDIPTLLPIVGLVDVLDGGARFRFRLLGTEVVDAAGYNPTGRYLDQALPDSGYSDYLIGLFREVVRARRPLYGESDLLGGDRVERHVRRLLMPLSRYGETVDMVFGGQVVIATSKNAAPRAKRPSAPSTRSRGCCWIRRRVPRVQVAPLTST